jgi:flavin-binding protein dodecin
MSSTYRFIELVGTSTKSWEDAASQAVEDAKAGLGGLRVAEVIRMDIKSTGDMLTYRVRLKVSFKAP